MEITRQCRIKGEIKESVSKRSATAVCSASQLDAEVWERAAEMALGTVGFLSFFYRSLERNFLSC